MKKILLISDNQELLTRFSEIITKKNSFIKHAELSFEYAFSFRNKSLKEKYVNENWIRSINVKQELTALIDNYELIISLHCKQIFPAELVEKVRCINIHPGLNPHNRGWFPQVFSILNGLPCGATIHEIDKDLDHGPVICQKEVKLESWDTSFTIYNKILDAEMDILFENFEEIILGTYETFQVEEGNINLKSDFDDLCEIDLSNVDSFLNHINKLRALTHGNYANAFFKDIDGNKVFLKIELTKAQ